MLYCKYSTTKCPTATTVHPGTDPETDSGVHLRTKITSSPFCPQTLHRKHQCTQRPVFHPPCTVTNSRSACLIFPSQTQCCLRPHKILESHTRLPRKSSWLNAKYCTCICADNQYEPAQQRNRLQDFCSYSPNMAADKEATYSHILSLYGQLISKQLPVYVMLCVHVLVQYSGGLYLHHRIANFVHVLLGDGPVACNGDFRTVRLWAEETKTTS